MKRKTLSLATVILTSCLALFGAAQTVLPSDANVIAAAKKEGEVSLYLSTNLTDANGLIQRFNQKYPFERGS